MSSFENCFIIWFKKGEILNSIKIPFPNNNKIEIVNDKVIGFFKNY
jgi:hypothetical protein